MKEKIKRNVAEMAAKVSMTTTTVVTFEVSADQIRKLVLEALKDRLPTEEEMRKVETTHVDFEFKVTADQYGDSAEFHGVAVVVRRTEVKTA